MSVAHLIMSVANNGEQAQYKSAAILLLAWNSSIPYISLAQDKAVRITMAIKISCGTQQLWNERSE